MFEMDMFKKFAAVVLMLLAGGAWFYLDHWNEQEILASTQMHRELELARAQAKTRAEEKVKFETHILVDFDNCKALAEARKIVYVAQNQVVGNRKSCQLTTPQTVVAEAAKMLETANAACQTSYDNQLKNGL